METTMRVTKTQWAKFRAALLAKRADLTGRPFGREEILIEHSADEMDEALRYADRDLAIAQLNRASEVLRNVRGALLRIDDGSYGVCLGCEQEIGRRRLQAVPWAPLCIGCQEVKDGGQNGSYDDLDADTVAQGHRTGIREAA